MPKTPSIDVSPVREIKISYRTDGDYSASRASDLSATGAFINTADPLPSGTMIGIRLEAPGREISAQAVVRRVIPGEGMGVEFQSMPADDRARLEAMLRQAEQLNIDEAADSGKPPSQPASPRSRLERTAERRARTRYKFAAPVELTESGASRPVSAQISNLGLHGCYVRIDSPAALGSALEISIAHNGQSFQARATVKSSQAGKGMGLTFTEVDPKNRQVLDEWLAAAMERAWLASNRRRSQRVIVSIPVQVQATDRFGAEHCEETKTISVSATGALLALEMELIKGQTITLRDPVSQDALECSVNYLGSASQGRREVGVSFVKPNHSLWRINFPPVDWSTQDPYAKGS
jgi:hypothetical protein